MKREFTKLMAALALLVFIAPPMVGWGQTRTDVTVTWYATSNDCLNPGSNSNSGTFSTGDFLWNYTRTPDGSNSLYTNFIGGDTRVVQLGKNGSSETITLSTSNIPGTIKSVSILCASYNQEHSVSISVGGTTYLSSTKTAKWQNNTVGTSTGTGSSSGLIEIAFTKSNSARALYIKSISVTYEESSGPTIAISPDAISVDDQQHSSGNGNDQALSMTTTIPGQNPNVYEVQYCATETGTYTSTAPAWMNAWVAYTTSFNVGWYIGQNTSSIPNECYFKVYNSANNVYSNAVHVTQTAAPTPTYTVTLTGGTTITADYQGTVTSSPITVSTNLTPNLGYQVLYNNNGNYTSTNPYDWFEADVNSSDQIESIFESNPTYSERIAQIKVYTTDGTNDAWSEVITVTQAAAPAPYINIVANHGETVENPYLIERPTWQNGGGFLREVEFGNFTVSGASDFQILYCNANGEPIDETPAMFSGVVVDYYYYQFFETYVYRLYVAVTNNNSTQDRSGYFKVWVNVNDTPVYSDLVTVHQPGKPQVATPTFSPVAGAVNAGTEVTISCTTQGAAIQYSTDGTNYNAYSTPITITEATTLYAKATAEGYVDSEVAMAQYTVKGNAVFEAGVYYESMETQQSFDNMQVVNVVGEEQTWEFNLSTEAAYMNGYNSGYVANTDWLITPKMAVENGKLNVSFGVKKSYASNQLSWKWSTSNDTNGDWNTLTFTEPSSGWGYPESDIETDAEYVYVAFVYDNTSATSAAAYYVYGFEARQYYNVTFNANNTEATGTMTALSCAAGVATALTDNVFAVAGKVFNGWNTQPDGQGDAYADGADITITANTTLYAQWEDAYKVKFMTNGVEDITVEVVQGQAIGTLPTANAAYIPSGYVFKGWYGGSYFSEDTAPTYIASPYTPSGDVTLYAVFAIPGESSYTLVGPSDVTEGTYIIGALKSTTATNNFYFATATTSSGAIKVNASSTAIPETSGVRSIASLPSGAVEFTFAGNNTNGFTISTIISASTKYLGYTSYENNKLSFNTDYSTFTWKAVEKANALVTNGVYLDNYTTNGHYYISENTTNDNCIRAYTSSSNIYRAIYLFKKAETSSTNYRTSLTATSNLTINGYSSDGIKDGYYLIASPVYVDPATVEGMTTEDFDLYYFDEAQGYEEWRNYEASNFNLVPGKGYLYAKKIAGATSTYNFTLTGAPYNGNGQVTLSKTDGTQFSGWNLIGNPYTNPATLGTTAFYKMNSTGSELESATLGSTIAAKEGVFVIAANDGDVVTFEEQQPSLEPNSGNAVSQLSINVNKSRGEAIDRAIVRFDNGNQLPKFQLNPNHTKVYFQQDSKDYAVVCSNDQGEMPVNFKAETSGTYTISVNAENTEMNYLHLIDNMTGADIDLLATPSYSFEAKTSDYASRFRLVFNANNGSNEEGNETFAYYNGSEWMINNMGDATLQVVDVMGRVLSSETVSGNATINLNQMPGVYMLRLINGDSVKVQKVVVR